MIGAHSVNWAPSCRYPPGGRRRSRYLLRDKVCTLCSTSFADIIATHEALSDENISGRKTLGMLATRSSCNNTSVRHRGASARHGARDLRLYAAATHQREDRSSPSRWHSRLVFMAPGKTHKKVYDSAHTRGMDISTYDTTRDQTRHLVSVGGQTDLQPSCAS